MATLQITRKEGQTILKNGRKTYATISYNNNPDYKWTIYFKSSLALSGYDSEEKAIERAEKMFNDTNNIIQSFVKL